MYLIQIFGNQTQPQHPQSDREREGTLTAEKHNTTTTGLAVTGDTNGRTCGDGGVDIKPGKERSTKRMN